MKIRCPLCRGFKKSSELGFIEKDCEPCKATGWVDKPEESKSEYEKIKDAQEVFQEHGIKDSKDVTFHHIEAGALGENNPPETISSNKEVKKHPGKPKKSDGKHA